MKYRNTTNVYALINQILHKHNIELELKTGVDLNIFSGENTIGWNRTNREKLLPIDKISNYIEENIIKPIETSGQILFHYLPNIKFLEDILTLNKIRMYNLNKYLISGDKSEYRHFLETFGVDFPKFEEQIESTKRDVYIWCLTSLENSERHWKEYANNGHGIAISVEFIEFKRKESSFNLVPVNYDLAFLREIQFSLRQEFNAQLEILKYPNFAKYFKHQCYNWESEIRLCLDAEAFNIHCKLQDFYHNSQDDRQEIESLFNVNFDENNQQYILVPLKNPVFEVHIKNIYCSKSQKNEIKKLIEDKGIEIILTNEL